MSIQRAGVYVDVFVSYEFRHTFLNHIKLETGYHVDTLNCQQVDDKYKVRIIFRLIGQGALFQVLKELSKDYDLEYKKGSFVEVNVNCDHYETFLKFIDNNPAYALDIPNCKQIGNNAQVRITLDVGNQGQLLEDLESFDKKLDMDTK